MNLNYTSSLVFPVPRLRYPERLPIDVHQTSIQRGRQISPLMHINDLVHLYFTAPVVGPIFGELFEVTICPEVNSMLCRNYRRKTCILPGTLWHVQ
jgi:hypothetical protein